MIPTFVDEATIDTRGGPGGNGCSSFRREKFVARGGPDGGDGGLGGSVYLEASEDLNTLLPFRYRPIYKGERGRHGEGSDRTGRSGEDLIVKVPVGTLVFDEDKVRLLADLDTPGARYLAAEGGTGGRGNARFVSSVTRAPTRFEEGREGQRHILNLELKLLADVGLLGFPNAGKSTLISRISAAKPKVADYPFTTLVPHLGVVRVNDRRSIVIADIPGLIEGAHEGQGLGDQFLRHVERCRMLLHLVDPTAFERDPVEAVQALDRELDLHHKDLAAKPQIVVITKMDVAQNEEHITAIEAYAAKTDRPVFKISAVQGDGLQALVAAMDDKLQTLEPQSSLTINTTKVEQIEQPVKLTPLGILGGTFDPVHSGHLSLAEQILAKFPLEKIQFMPCADPPHKDAASILSAEHRLEMVRLALIGRDRMEPSSFEIDRGGKSYTVETLQQLKATHPEVQPFFIMGADSLMQLASWYKAKRLVEGFNLIVCDRPEITLDIDQLEPWIQEKIQPFETLTESIDPLKPQIYVVRVPPKAIASSDIRLAIEMGEPIEQLVPAPVDRYIRKHNLYQ